MKATFLMLILSLPPQAPPLTLAPMQAPAVTELQVQPVPDDYAHLARVCAAERKPFVVFCGVPMRPVTGLTVCSGALVERGVIIGIPANGWLDRYDLPADATDEAIHAIIYSKMTQRKEVRQNTSAMPATFQRQQVFRSSGGRSASC